MRTTVAAVLVGVTGALSACEAAGDDAARAADAMAAADAGPVEPDAAAAPLDAGPLAPVNVTMFREDTPLAGADVVVHDATGAPVLHTALDATGHVSTDVPAGGAVTVIWPPGEDLYTTVVAYTFRDVEPGDDIRLGPYKLPPRDPVGTAHVTLPGAFPGATFYGIDMGCNGAFADPASGPKAIALDTACLDTDGTFAVVVSAWDAQYNLLATSSLVGIPAPPAGDGQVVLPAWRSDLARLDLAVTGAPADAFYVQADLVPYDGAVEHQLIWRQPLFGDGTLSMPFAPDAFDRYAFFYTLHFQGGGGVHLERGGSFPIPALALDFLADFLPRVRDVTVEVDAGSHMPRVGWTVDAPVPTALGVGVSTSWKTPTHDHYWVVFAPPGAPSPLDFPSLPDELAAYRVAPDATEVHAAVSYVDSDLWPDEDSYRQRPVGPLQRPDVYVQRTTFGESPAVAP